MRLESEDYGRRRVHEDSRSVGSTTTCNSTDAVKSTCSVAPAEEREAANDKQRETKKESEPVRPLLYQPILEGIPKLVFVDLQQENSIKAAVAMEKVQDLVVGDSILNTKHRDTLKSLGGHALIIAALNKHWYTESFHPPAFLVLGWLVNYKDRPIGQSLVRSGALETVANAMMTHKSSAAVRESGCLALHTLLWASSGGDGKNDPIGRRFILDLGGISMLLDTMKEFPNSFKVNFHAIQCLMRFLHYGPKAKEVLKNGKAVSLVAATIENHPKEKPLQKAAEIFMSDFFAC